MAAAAALLVFSALVVGVHDGDTVKVRTEAGELRSIRLAAIDAPELGQPWGRASGDSLRRLCLGKRATIRPQAIDKYRRTVADVQCGSTDANRHQVERGMDWVYVKYAPPDTPLLPLQAQAQHYRRGLWMAGYTTPPWRWRHPQQ
jgi:micrococcal nuclease